MTQVDEAVTAAGAAFERARRRPLRERGGWLRAIGAALEEAADELVPIAAAETHLPEARLRGELKRTVFQTRLLAAEVDAGEFLDATIDHADPDWPMGPRPDLRRTNVPLGVVAVFGASNFPFAFSVPGGDTVSALAAGCPVVHKGHPDHAHLATRTAEIVISALRGAGAPESMLSLIMDRDAGAELVRHPLVQAVGFTGSTAGGRALFDLAAGRPQPIPFYGELGSTNPVFVTAAAWASRRAEILDGYVASASMGMGQFCTKPGYLVVPELSADDRDRVGAVARSVVRHDMLSPRLRESFEATTIAFAERAASLDESVPADELPGITFLSMPAADAAADPALLGAELFGPASVLVVGAADDQLAAIAAGLEGQLTATVFAEDGDDIAELVRVLESKAGRILFGEWPTGVSVTYAQQHGGPYPASTAAGTTSVGTAAIRRFLRPVAFQNAPAAVLPPELVDANPLGIRRRVDGVWETP
jgi:NADP-dependent aldehyde dehydrogenase